MRAVIIDDEASLRESTTTLLSIYSPDIEIVGQAGGVKSGIQLIKDTNPDLVFLDVEMPDGMGFDVVHSFRDRKFAVIFITGHNEYAVKAFRLSAIDYIMKPVDPDLLEKAVNKVRHSFANGMMELQMKALESNFGQKKLKRIVLKDAEKVYLISLDEIIRCESSDNYTSFYLSDQRVILVSTTLKEYENLLGDQGFFRCHQSHLINLTFFDHFERKTGGTLTMKDGSIIPVASRKRDTLMKALESM